MVRRGFVRLLALDCVCVRPCTVSNPETKRVAACDEVRYRYTTGHSNRRRAPTAESQGIRNDLRYFCRAHSSAAASPCVREHGCGMMDDAQRHGLRRTAPRVKEGCISLTELLIDFATSMQGLSIPLE